MKHKHHDVIVAWAEGKKIEYCNNEHEWRTVNEPSWSTILEYRVKPYQPVSKWLWSYSSGIMNTLFMNDEEVKNINCHSDDQLTVKLYFTETIFLI